MLGVFFETQCTGGTLKSTTKLANEFDVASYSTTDDVSKILITIYVMQLYITTVSVSISNKEAATVITTYMVEQKSEICTRYSNST